MEGETERRIKREGGKIGRKEKGVREGTERITRMEKGGKKMSEEE